MNDPRLTNHTMASRAAAATAPVAGRVARRPGPAALASGLPLLVLVGTLTACTTGGGNGETGAQRPSGGADQPDAQAYVDAGVTSLTADPEFPLDRQTATCISTATVDLLGADALARAGVDPREFGEAETYAGLGVDVPEDGMARLSESFDGCDVPGAFASIFATGLGVELPPDGVACVDEHIDRQAVNDAVAGALLTPSAATAQDAATTYERSLETALIDAVLACPSVTTAVFLAEVSGTVTPEAEACVSAVAEAEPDRMSAILRGDAGAAEELGIEIASACPGAFG